MSSARNGHVLGQPAIVQHVHRSARAVSMMPTCPRSGMKNGHVPLGGPIREDMSIAQPRVSMMPHPAGHVHRSLRAEDMRPKCPLAALKIGHVPPGEMFTRNEFLALALTEC